MIETPLLTEREAAEFVRHAPGTLQNKRVNGDGPAFLKVGAKVLYRREDLLAWVEGHRRTSTADSGRRSKPRRRRREGAGEAASG
jgi:hypothetical protein